MEPSNKFAGIDVEETGEANDGEQGGRRFAPLDLPNECSIDAGPQRQRLLRQAETFAMATDPSPELEREVGGTDGSAHASDAGRSPYKRRPDTTSILWVLRRRATGPAMVAMCLIVVSCSSSTAPAATDSEPIVVSTMSPRDAQVDLCTSVIATALYDLVDAAVAGDQTPYGAAVSMVRAEYGIESPEYELLMQLAPAAINEGIRHGVAAGYAAADPRQGCQSIHESPPTVPPETTTTTTRPAPPPSHSQADTTSAHTAATGFVNAWAGKDWNEAARWATADAVFSAQEAGAIPDPPTLDCPSDPDQGCSLYSTTGDLLTLQFTKTTNGDYLVVDAHLLLSAATIASNPPDTSDAVDADDGCDVTPSGCHPPGARCGTLGVDVIERGDGIPDPCPEVTAIQKHLVDFGFQVDIDGQFGHGTETAVRQFQANEGLPIDGRVGPETWDALEQGPGDY